MEKNTLVYDVRPISTIRELIETSADEFKNRTAFVLKDNDKLYEKRYHDVLEDVKNLSTFLNARGFEGKRVAVIGKNSYNWALTYLAVTSGTGVIVPIDKDLKAPEITNILTLSEASAVLFSPELASTVASIDLPLEKLPMADMNTYLAEGSSLRIGGDMSYEKHVIDPYALGVLIYTSGTTGIAKGVMLSQYNICSDIVAVLKQVKITPEDRTLSVLPLHHTYESMAGFLSILYSGASIAYMTSLTHLLADFREYQPTIFIAVPLLLKTVHSGIIKKVKAVPGGSAYLVVGKAITTLSGAFSYQVASKVFANVHAAFGGKLKTILCGAAALDPAIFKDFQKLGFHVLCGYGLTETSPICVMHSDHVIKPGTVGLPICGSKAKILDPNEEGIGELAVKGPNVMLGYYKNPEATAEAFTADGYFRTGDLAKIDPASGHYIITGRIKNMIVIGNGKKVFPEEIEYLLDKCDGVKECMAYGHVDEEGYVMVAVKIFPDFEYLKKQGIETEGENAKKALEEYFRTVVKEKVNRNLPGYKAVRKITLRYREFDKTTTKKIRRNSADNMEE